MVPGRSSLADRRQGPAQGPSRPVRALPTAGIREGACVYRASPRREISHCPMASGGCARRCAVRLISRVRSVRACPFRGPVSARAGASIRGANPGLGAYPGRIGHATRVFCLPLSRGPWSQGEAAGNTCDSPGTKPTSGAGQTGIPSCPRRVARAGRAGVTLGLRQAAGPIGGSTGERPGPCACHSTRGPGRQRGAQKTRASPFFPSTLRRRRDSAGGADLAGRASLQRRGRDSAGDIIRG